MTTYELPDRPTGPDYSAGVDGASQLDQYFRRAASQQYQAPSLESYYTSRASTASARGLTTAQADYVPPGAPYRFTANLLDDLTGAAVASPLGVVGGLSQPEQRGGTVDALGLPLKTVPVNVANAATYAREAPLSVITSILGQHYQKPEGGDPYAKPEGLAGNNANIFENIGHANFPGVLDNLIDGVGEVGDAVFAPFKAAGDWLRNDAASNRAEQVAQLITTGHGTPTLIALATHVLDMSSISEMSRIHEAAIKKGVTDTQMLADLWNLSPDVVEQIQHQPNMSHDEFYKLTAGQPFSYKAFENLIGELGVTLAPMVIGAGELRGLGALAGALRGGRTLEAVAGAEKLGFTAPLISRAIGAERAAAIGDRIAAISASSASAGAKFSASSQVLGMWSMPNAWRFVRPVLKVGGLVAGVSPNAYKLGAGIRIGEWMFGQAGALLGNQAMIDMADRWLYETPLSDNPGLQMADAFVVHPLRTAKEIYTQGRAATLNVIGHGELPISRAHAQALGTIADLNLDDLHARVLEHLGWDKGTVKGLFENDQSPLSILDLKNGLYHVALSVVRDRHPESRIIPAGSIVARAVEFVRRYGDEASALLRDEANGRGHALADAITDEFWTRHRIAEGSSVGLQGGIGPYDPHTALVQFASWIHASKEYQKAFGDEYVPALRTDVNTEFLTQYRAEIAAKYKPGEKLSATDINRLVTFIPVAKTKVPALRTQARVPKITQAAMMRFLDDLEAGQRINDANRALPRTERVAAIRPEDATAPDKIATHFNLRADTVEALLRAQKDGTEGFGPLPAELIKVLTTVFRMNADEIKRDPTMAWNRALAWFENQYSSAVERGNAIDITERFGRRLAAAVPPADLPAVNAAIERVIHGLRHPYAAHDPTGAPVPPNIMALLEARTNAAADFVGRAEAWLNDPRSRMVARDIGEGPLLETANMTAEIADHIRLLADKVLAGDNDPALNAADLAMLADPATHPVELAGILQRATTALSETDQATLRNRPGDFETAYGTQFAEIADPSADPAPITRAMVDKLTKEVVASAAEREALIASAKDIASVVDHNPRASMLPDLADWLDRATVLGTTKIGRGERGAEIARWRGLPVEATAVEAVSNEAALARARSAIDSRVASLQDEVLAAARAREVASDRINAPLGPEDFTWADTPDRTFTRKADAQSHATLMADAGVPQRILRVDGPRGGTQWGVFAGELKPRPEGLTPAEIAALQAEVAAARAPGDAAFAAAQAPATPPAPAAEVVLGSGLRGIGLIWGEGNVPRDTYWSAKRAKDYATAGGVLRRVDEARRVIVEDLNAKRAADGLGPLRPSDLTFFGEFAEDAGWHLNPTEPAAVSRLRVGGTRGGGAAREVLQEDLRPLDPGDAGEHRWATVGDRKELAKVIAYQTERIRKNEVSLAKQTTPDARYYFEHEIADARHVLTETQTYLARWDAGDLEWHGALGDTGSPVAAPPAPEVPGAAPVVVERLAEPDRIAQAKADAYAAEQAARQAAFAAHAEAFPERVKVPYTAAEPAAAVGDLVKFKMSAVVKGKPGTMNAAGTVAKLLPDGGVEVRLQAGGYHTLARGEFEARAASKPTPAEVTFLDPQDNATPIRSHVVIVEAGDVLTSADPAYPAVFQPRSRGLRVESDRQIRDIAARPDPTKLFGMTEGDSGSPIISPDGFVLSGNGRTEGLRLATEAAYRPYKEALKVEAAKYGFDPAVIDGMERPVLFRQLEGVDPVTMRRLAWQLNGKGFPIGDLAVAFADEVTATNLEALKIAEKQDLRDALTADKNTAIVSAIIDKVPPDWRNTYIGPDGRPSEQGVKLVEGAIFAKLLRADVPGPHQDAARDLVVVSIEQGGEEMRRVFNGVYAAAAAMLKAQGRADSGPAGGHYLETIDTLSQALTEILRRRRDDKAMAQIAIELQTVDAFAEYSTPPQVGHMGAVLASSTQSEIATFLRGVANATEANASVGMFEEAAPVTTTGLLNSGIAKWNEVRKAAGKTEMDNFPSGDAPYDIAISPPRQLPSAVDAPPVLLSQPLQPGELAGEVSARTLGQALRVEAETIGDAAGATERPAGVITRDPSDASYVEAYRADPEGVRGDVADAFDLARSFTDDTARRDYLKSLIDTVNDGTAQPGDWAVLKQLVGSENIGTAMLRRNTRGRLNMAPILRTNVLMSWEARVADGLTRAMGELDWLDRAGEIDPTTPRLVHVPPQGALTEAELHAVTGPDVPLVPVDPVATDLATSSEHTITTNDNPTIEAAVRRETGAPAVRSSGQRAMEFNAPRGAAQVERLAAIEQAKRAKLEAAQQQLRDFQTNPPLPTTSPRGSVFADATSRDLWDRLMKSGVDPIAQATGSQEPRSLAEVIDAIQSIDRGSLTDPATGVGITPEEAPILRAELMRIAEGTLTTATGRVAGAKAKARNIRVRVPDDFDAEGMADAMDKLTDQVAPFVSSDPSIPKLDGFAGTQYFPSPPTGASGEAGTITPRLPFHDWINSDLVPGLKEELASGRMMEPAERIRRSRALSVIEHLIGPRSQRAMTANAVRIFRDQLEARLGGDLNSAEAEALTKAVDLTIQGWRDHLESVVISPLPFQIFRRIDLMGPKKMNAIMAGVFEKAAPDMYEALGGKNFNVDPVWRQADNRIRQFLLDQKMPLSTAIEHYYGALADSGIGRAGRWLSVVYHVERFTAELRWLGLEVTEPIALGYFHGGLQTVWNALSADRAAKAGHPLGFGGLAQRNYFREYAHWTRASDIEQVTPLRQRVIMLELGRRQKAPFRQAVMDALAKDPQLDRIMADLGDTPHEYIKRLDRDYQLLEQGAQHFATEGEAAAFFKPWLDSGVIDEGTYAEYVKNKVYSSDPRIEAELAKTNDPLAHALYTRLAQINHDLMHDLTATFFGQENRSNLQRVLNHPLLYWPISYQIKATKWLIRFMAQESFGVETGMLPAVALQRVYERHKELMATSAQYRKDLSDNSTLYFLASMFLPIAPWDIGVSLSPWTRQALSVGGIGPDYQRPFGIFGFGPFATYGMAARLIHEKFHADLPLLEQLAPVVISTRSKPASRVEQAAQQAAGAADIPYQVPEVPRLP